MTASAVDSFIDRLAAVPAGPDWTNFYDHNLPAHALRRHNLRTYLTDMLKRRPDVLLVGEAPGFRGMRLTGVPFTNRAMFEGPANSFGLFGAGAGYVLPPDAAGVPLEPTATVMWEVLAELEFLPLLWSAFPWHPHLPGKPLSNRTPRPAEVPLGTPFWQELSRIFAVRTVVAVGNVAHRSILRSGQEAPKIRHPAHGGRAGFKQGLEQLLLQ